MCVMLHFELNEASLKLLEEDYPLNPTITSIYFIHLESLTGCHILDLPIALKSFN